MVHVARIHARDKCASCLDILTLVLSDGEQVTPDEAYRWIVAGAVLRVGSERGPPLRAAVLGDVRYVRARDADTPEDELLRLPRGL